VDNRPLDGLPNVLAVPSTAYAHAAQPRWRSTFLALLAARFSSNVLSAFFFTFFFWFIPLPIAIPLLDD